MTIERIRIAHYKAALERLRRHSNWIDIQSIVPPEMTGIGSVMADMITVVMMSLTGST